MKPFSAFYYIRENKSKVCISIFMILLTAGLYILGNFIDAAPSSFEKAYEYSDKMVLVGGLSSDEDFQDYFALMEDAKNDPKLHVLVRSGRGFPGLEHKTAMGFMMGGNSYVFDSVEDMKLAFGRLGIDCDFTNVKNGSLVISTNLADNRGIKLGDVIDRSFDSSVSGSHTVDALVDDQSYTCFYVEEDPGNPLRMYLYSDTMEGAELRDYVSKLVGDKKVQIAKSYREQVASQFDMFYVIFYAVTILISVIMAVTVNSVVTGQYLKRTFEFGVYRALGFSKGQVARKCAGEILSMDGIAVVLGMVIALLASYLLNELRFLPQGIFLPYCSKVACVGFLLCNVLIVLPLILSKSGMCSRADVTEF